MLTLTDTASTKVKELIQAEDNPELVLRVAVRPGGCSGLSYEMFFDTDVAADDVASEFGDVKVVVDPASSQYLTGASLDYKDGLQGAGFTINNPNLRVRPVVLLINRSTEPRLGARRPRSGGVVSRSPLLLTPRPCARTLEL